MVMPGNPLHGSSLQRMNRSRLLCRLVIIVLIFCLGDDEQGHTRTVRGCQGHRS